METSQRLGYPYPLNIDETLTKYILGLLLEEMAKRTFPADPN